MKIDNTVIISALCACYKAYSAAQTICAGFTIGGNVYAAFIPTDIFIDNFSGISVTSSTFNIDGIERTAKRLRVKPLTKATERLFYSFNPVLICSETELKQTAKNRFSGNCGECFESLCVAFFGGKQSPQNTPFWEAGDMTLNGQEIQIKFQCATIIHEKHMEMINR